MTVAEAAAAYHYCERHIRGLAQDGRIAARKTSDGYWLVERHSVQAYAERWKDLRNYHDSLLKRDKTNLREGTMPVNPAHFGSFTFLDATREKSSMTFNFGPITAVTLPGFLTQFADLRTKTEAITLGALASDQWTGDRTVYSVTPPTDRNAQRERKFLVIYRDNTSLALYRVEIPTADYGIATFGPSGDEIIIGTSGPIYDWVQSFQTLARSPEGNAVTVISIKGVGRNI
jgi:hypothetical protein